MNNTSVSFHLILKVVQAMRLLCLVTVMWSSYSFESAARADTAFRLEEAGVSEINAAFESGILTSEKLVELILESN